MAENLHKGLVRIETTHQVFLRRVVHSYERPCSLTVPAADVPTAPDD